MPGQNLNINSLAQGSVVGRLLSISGRLTQANGSVFGVQVQFGNGGPTFDATTVDVTVLPHPRRPGDPVVLKRSWQGNVPNNIRPGQAFEIIVSSTGVIGIPIRQDPGDFNEVDVSGSASIDVVLENVVPVLTVNGASEPPFFQSLIVVTQSPSAFALNVTVSEGNGPPYAPKVHYQIGDGPLTELLNEKDNDRAMQAAARITSPPMP